jgi:hypothetical protein
MDVLRAQHAHHVSSLERLKPSTNSPASGQYSGGDGSQRDKWRFAPCVGARNFPVDRHAAPSKDVTALAGGAIDMVLVSTSIWNKSAVEPWFGVQDSSGSLGHRSSIRICVRPRSSVGGLVTGRTWIAQRVAPKRVSDTFWGADRWTGSTRSPQIQPAASGSRRWRVETGPRFTYSENWSDS